MCTKYYICSHLSNKSHGVYSLSLSGRGDVHLETWPPTHPPCASPSQRCPLRWEHSVALAGLQHESPWEPNEHRVEGGEREMEREGEREEGERKEGERGDGGRGKEGWVWVVWVISITVECSYQWSMIIELHKLITTTNLMCMYSASACTCTCTCTLYVCQPTSIQGLHYIPISTLQAHTYSHNYIYSIHTNSMYQACTYKQHVCMHIGPRSYIAMTFQYLQLLMTKVSTFTCTMYHIVSCL